MIVSVLTWIGILIGLLILLLLIIPVRIFGEGSVDDRKGLEYRLIIDWAFGIFSLRAVSGIPAGLYVAGLRVCSVRFKKEKKKKLPKKKFSPLTWLGWMRGNFPRIQRLLSRFAHASYLRGYFIGKIGLADPADTAFIGLLCRLIQIRTDRFSIAVTTVYDYEMIHVRAKIQSTLIIGYLGFVALGMLLDKEIRVMLGGLPQT